MSDRRPEPAKSKKAEPQKKSETTILSPEELRAISGGVTQPKPPPTPNVVTTIKQ
jgi:hypothetical protein